MCVPFAAFGDDVVVVGNKGLWKEKKRIERKIVMHHIIEM